MNLTGEKFNKDLCVKHLARLPLQYVRILDMKLTDDNTVTFDSMLTAALRRRAIQDDKERMKEIESS